MLIDNSLTRQQARLQRFDHGGGNLILHLEDVIELPVIGFRPDVIAVVGADELGGDTQTIA